MKLVEEKRMLRHDHREISPIARPSPVLSDKKKHQCVEDGGLSPFFN